jgi:hypothetical protein
MPRGGSNRMPAEVKRRYFELIWPGRWGRMHVCTETICEALYWA